MVATFYYSSGTEALVVPIHKEACEISVSVHQLEREFKVGDVVKRIATVVGEPVRIGSVVKIVDLHEESKVKAKRNKRILDEEPDIASQGRYYKRLINEYGGVAKRPGQGSGENRAKAEQFRPHSLYAAQVPCLLEVTILEKSSLTEVSQRIH